MKTIFRSLVLASLALMSSACTIRHAVQQDYPQYLANNTGAAKLPTTKKATLYFLAPTTEAYSYEFRAVMTGAANLWVVEVGKMLDDTLRSADVQVAFGSMTKTNLASGALDSTLVFDLLSYTFEQFGAHISLNVSLARAGKATFQKTYTESGKTQGGKMFWAGAFGQKNAVQQSTKLAIDEILRQLINDVNNQP